jgi:phosphate transport system permease protein
MRISVSDWTRSGSPWVWLNAGAVAICIIMVLGLLSLIAVRGLGHFWPSDVLSASYEQNGQRSVLVGELVESELVPAAQLRDSGVDVPAGVDHMQRDLFKVGNRDVTGADFVWALDDSVTERSYPAMMFVAERREWGNLYGYLQAIKQDGELVAQHDGYAPGPEYAALWQDFQRRISRAQDLHAQIEDIQQGVIGSINYELERLRLKQRSLELKNVTDPQPYADIEERRNELNAEYEVLQVQLLELSNALNRDSFVAEVAGGRSVEVQLSKVVRAFLPNSMHLGDKVMHYLAKIWEFIADDPREANTEGGIFPAIYGTVMMVLLMSVMVTPFGVIAAVYLREYARQGFTTRVLRIAVNNLAGVPSIVYGVFGLGFFVYFLGGSIDDLFFPEAKPSPTFGTGGLMWASLTLALLTVPVVIVATEEGLSRIPRAVREGSLALGATKAETLWKVVLPMASPAIMTGVILAIARAAGEVAPLMLVGVVKLAPSLPLDMNYPYLHLDQKFMHLGFHIYDVGFQSPNVEAARPLVYATALLLVVVIALLNFSAIAIRNHLREKYKALEM